MRKIKKVLRLAATGQSSRRFGGAWDLSRHAMRIPGAGPEGGAELAPVEGVDGPGTQGPAIPRAAAIEHPPAAAKVDRGAPGNNRSQAHLRDPQIVAGGVHGGAPDGLQYSQFCELYRRGAPSIESCGTSTTRGRRCSSSTPGRPCRSWTTPRARSERRRSSSACWESATSPTPRRVGARRCPSGSEHTHTCSAACPNSWSSIIWPFT